MLEGTPPEAIPDVAAVTGCPVATCPLAGWPIAAAPWAACPDAACPDAGSSPGVGGPRVGGRMGVCMVPSGSPPNTDRPGATAIWSSPARQCWVASKPRASPHSGCRLRRSEGGSLTRDSPRRQTSHSHLRRQSLRESGVGAGVASAGRRRAYPGAGPCRGPVFSISSGCRLPLGAVAAVAEPAARKGV